MCIQPQPTQPQTPTSTPFTSEPQATGPIPTSEPPTSEIPSSEPLSSEPITSEPPSSTPLVLEPSSPYISYLANTSTEIILYDPKSHNFLDCINMFGLNAKKKAAELMVSSSVSPDS